MNKQFAFGVIGSGGLFLGYCVNKYLNKHVKTTAYDFNMHHIESERPQFNLLNLTPHSISLYKNDKHIIDILPEDKHMRLRLNTDIDKHPYLFNFSVDKHKVYDSNIFRVTNSAIFDINVRKPIDYNIVDNIDNIPNNKDIITSSIVAEYLINNRDYYKNKFGYIFSPDTDPKNVVRDETGKIIGVKGLVCHGSLFYTLGNLK